MKRLSTIIFLLCLIGYHPFTISASSPQLSETARVSLLTCSAGQELYSLFGHCALRIQDTVLNLDKVYNYGTFDFAAPDFYLNFVRGKLFYFLSVTNFRTFKLEYIMANRGITEQELNLYHAERQLLFSYLEENYLPRNRHYLYHYFLNNCASKIWEVVVKAIKPTSSIQFKPSKKEESFRQLIEPYIKNRSWLDFGLHLCLGLPCDRLATTTERMFLPQLLKKGFTEASISRGGDSQPLIKDESIIVKSASSSESHREWFTPHLFFWLLLALIGMVSYFFEGRKKIQLLWIDRALFSLTGLVGLFITLLWFVTNHDFAAINLNLLWAMPLHLIFLFRLKTKKTRKVTRYYFFICGVICLLIVLLWPFNPQTFHSALIPLLLIITYRCIHISRQKGG